MSRDSRIGTYKVEMVDCQARRLGRRRYRLPNNNRQIYNVGLMKPAQPTMLFTRHSREGGNPSLRDENWIPAFAGMTVNYCCNDLELV